MLLYNSQVSGNCYKVRLLFAHLGHRLRAARGRRDRPLQPSASCSAPSTRRCACRRWCSMTAARWPSPTRSSSTSPTGRQYLPTDRFERAQVLQWMFFEQYSHEPNIAVARFWAHRGDRAGPPPTSRPSGAAGSRRSQAMERHLETRDSSSASATRSPTSPCTPTRTSPPREGSTLEPYEPLREWLERIGGDRVTRSRLSRGRRARGVEVEPASSAGDMEPGPVSACALGPAGRVRGLCEPPGDRLARPRTSRSGIGTGESLSAAAAHEQPRLRLRHERRQLLALARGQVARRVRGRAARASTSRRRSNGSSLIKWLTREQSRSRRSPAASAPGSDGGRDLTAGPAMPC